MKFLYIWLLLCLHLHSQDLPRQTTQVNQVSLDVWKAVSIHYSNISLSPTTFPHYTSNDGKSWVYGDVGSWTTGFLPGIYWHAYNATGNEMFRSLAIQSQLLLIKNMIESYQIGFVIQTSFSLSLEMTNYRNVTEDGIKRVSASAVSLSIYYTQSIGCISSNSYLSNQNNTFGFPSNSNQTSSTSSGSGQQVTVSIESILSIEVLFQASVITGNQTYFYMARTHADLMIKNQFRSDGSVYQKVVYDSVSGTVISKSNEYGLSDSSTWARGQAFAIYGYTMVYRYTNEWRFLDAAVRASSYYLSRMPQNQYVPNWDLEFLGNNTNSNNWNSSDSQDTSASVIVASAFQELASFLSTSDPLRRTYYEFSVQTYLFLYNTQGYLDLSGNSASIVLHGSVYVSQRVSNVGLIYSDYYLLEGLNRLKYIRLFDPSYRAGGYLMNDQNNASQKVNWSLGLLLLLLIIVL